MKIFNNIAKVIATVIFLHITSVSAQNTCVAVGGDWDDNRTWRNCDRNIPQHGDIVHIPDNVTVTVSAANQYSANGTAPFMHVYVGDDDADTEGGHISFDGKLNLAQGSSFVVYEHSYTTDDASGNSEKIRWWTPSGSPAGTLSGSETALTGPVTVIDAVIISGINDPLPVEFLYIETTSIDQTVSIDWATIIEENNSHFTIERSQNGQYDWEAIAIVEGAGNSNNVITYRIEDKAPLSGTSYYRVKQTDYDGKYSYSKVVANTASASASIYPNPATSVLNISGSEEEIKTIRIFNSRGEEIDLSNEISSIDNQLKKINVSGLTSGVYFVATTTTKQAIHIR